MKMILSPPSVQLATMEGELFDPRRAVELNGLGAQLLKSYGGVCGTWTRSETAEIRSAHTLSSTTVVPQADLFSAGDLLGHSSSEFDESVQIALSASCVWVAGRLTVHLSLNELATPSAMARCTKAPSTVVPGGSEAVLVGSVEDVPGGSEAI